MYLATAKTAATLSLWELCDLWMTSKEQRYIVICCMICCTVDCSRRKWSIGLPCQC